MRFALAATGTVLGVLAALVAAWLLAWEAGMILTGLLVAYLSATQVDVDRQSQPKPEEPEILE